MNVLGANEPVGVARGDEAREREATELLLQFAERTGVASPAGGHRYLWTDAFAVCSLLGLGHRGLALGLVDRVHRELGRYAPGDRRSGWISGLPEPEGEAHPTIGGLRIGKPLPERGLDEPFDPDREWDRDGQYFHYLTQWMHALDHVTRETGQAKFHVWARELADTAYRAFVYGPRGRRRMVWKLSVDGSRPLVRSAGHLDPLDGFVTCAQLQRTAMDLGIPQIPDLTTAIDDFEQMLERDNLATTDPLGLGGLLIDAWRLAYSRPSAHGLIEAILTAASYGLRQFALRSELRASSAHRLAFRELGLAIGLAAVAAMLDGDALPRELGASVRGALGQVATYLPMREAIESFWRRADHRSGSSWIQHADINDVMLATSLEPGGFLGMRHRA